MTRDAAAAWFYALCFEPKQDLPQLQALLQECYPSADFQEVQAIVLHRKAFADVLDPLVDELMALPMGDNFENLPYRNATLKVLTIDYFAHLKSQQAILAQDAVTRVTRFLDEKLRGTTKNATQTLAGQRTKMRKIVRCLILAASYANQYCTNETVQLLSSNFIEVLRPTQETQLVNEDFPIPELWNEHGELNARGRFALVQASRFLEKLESAKPQIDEQLQKASVKWRLSRISPIDLNLLRIASYEILFEKLASPRIIMSDAVDLAKEFGAEQCKNFVNGILQQVCTNCSLENESNVI